VRPASRCATRIDRADPLCAAVSMPAALPRVQKTDHDKALRPTYIVRNDCSHRNFAFGAGGRNNAPALQVKSATPLPPLISKVTACLVPT
jgi:hypothetical protein